MDYRFAERRVLKFQQSHFLLGFLHSYSQLTSRVTSVSKNEMNMFKIYANAGHYKEQFECSFHSRKYWSSCYASFSVRDLQSKLVVKHINVMSL